MQKFHNKLNRNQHKQLIRAIEKAKNNLEKIHINKNITFLKNMLENLGPQGELYRYLGKSYSVLEENESALTMFQNAITFGCSDQQDCYFQMGCAYLNLSDNSNAIKYFELAKEHGKNDFYLNINIIYCYIEENKLDIAYELLQALAASAEKKGRSEKYAISVAYMRYYIKIKDEKKVFHYIKNIEEFYPNRCSSDIQRAAKFFRSQENYKRSIIFHHKLLKYEEFVQVEKSEIYLTIAVDFEKIQKYQKSIFYYKKALDYKFHNPNEAAIKNNIGMAYLNLKRYDEAKFWFEQSLLVDSQYRLAHENLEIVNENIENLKNSLPKQIEILIDDPYININYCNGLNFLEQKKYSEAANCFILANNDGVDAYRELALSYYMLEDYKSALNNYNKKIEIINTQKVEMPAAYFYERALIHLELGNLIESKSDLNHAKSNLTQEEPSCWLNNIEDTLKVVCAKLAEHIKFHDDISNKQLSKSPSFHSKSPSITQLKGSLTDSLLNELRI